MLEKKRVSERMQRTRNIRKRVETVKEEEEEEELFFGGIAVISV